MPNSGMANQRSRRRLRADVGATFVEYALVFVVMVVGSLGIAQFLTNWGSSEVASQADCVSQRPPPPSCQVRVATPTTSTTSLGVTTTTAAPPTTTTTTTTPSTTAPRPPTLSTATSVGRPGTYNGVTTTITLLSGPNPVSGATVIIRYEAVANGVSVTFEVSCITSATGTCEARFDSPYDDTTSIQVTVYEVRSNPPPGAYPPPEIVNFP